MFATNFKEINDNIPAGTYEAVILSTGEDSMSITIKLEIRKDVDQDCAGRRLSHWIHKSREPKELDMAVGGYSFNQLMRIGKAARLPEGKSYEALGDYLTDLAGRAVQVELYYDEYKGKNYLKVKYWNESTAPALSYRPEAPQSNQNQAPFVQQSNQTASYQPNRANANKLPWE